MCTIDFVTAAATTMKKKCLQTKDEWNSVHCRKRLRTGTEAVCSPKTADNTRLQNRKLYFENKKREREKKTTKKKQQPTPD